MRPPAGRRSASWAAGISNTGGCSRRSSSSASWATWKCSADLGRPWKARALYHFEGVRPLAEPTDIVDISETFETKMEAWKCFQCGAEFMDQPGTRRRVDGGVGGGSLTDQVEALQRSAFLPRAVTDASLL